MQTPKPPPNAPLVCVPYPLTPTERRKGGALPGILFCKPDIVVQPSQKEIERMRSYYAAQLDEGANCPCCTRYAKRQARGLASGMTRWLIELVRLSFNGEWVQTGTVLKNLSGANIKGTDATSILPLYRLIEQRPNKPVHGDSKPRTQGFWRPTKLGRVFVAGDVRLPRKVVICLGVPECFEDPNDLIDCREALGKHFNYDEIMGKVDVRNPKF